MMSTQYRANRIVLSSSLPSPICIGWACCEKSKIETTIDATAATTAASDPRRIAVSRTKTKNGAQQSPIASLQCIELRMTVATGSEIKIQRMTHLPASGGATNQLRNKSVRVMTASQPSQKGWE